MLKVTAVALAWTLLFGGVVFAQAVVKPGSAMIYITVSAEGADSSGRIVDKQLSQGSGFLVGDGWVVTAKHVLDVAVPSTAKKVIKGTLQSQATYELHVQPGALTDADVTLLRFPTDLGIDYPFFCVVQNPDVKLGVHAFGLGFPLGKDLLSTRPGAITADADPAGMIQTNMGLADGMSGGPVLDDHNAVIGVITGGWAGESSFDFFTPSNQALGVFNVPPAEFAGKDCAGGGGPATIVRDFEVNETYNSQALALPTTKDFTVTEQADDGYVINDAKFDPTSQNQMDDLTINVAGGRRSASMTFTLTAGPFYDQTRGWLHGTLRLFEKTDKSP